MAGLDFINGVSNLIEIRVCKDAIHLTVPRFERASGDAVFVGHRSLLRAGCHGFSLALVVGFDGLRPSVTAISGVCPFMPRP